MAFALVGSLGAVASSSSGGTLSSTNGLAYGQTPTATHLLVLWVVCSTQSALTAPTGWTAPPSSEGGMAYFYKVASGGDAIPSVPAVSGAVLTGQLGEFSGNAASSPIDQHGVAAATTVSTTCSNGAADTAADELVVLVANATYTTSATRTLTHSLNNGATVSSVNNNTTSTTTHYNWGYGITTGNGSADSDTFTLSTISKLSFAGVDMASFKLGASAPIPLPGRIVRAAIKRASFY